MNKQRSALLPASLLLLVIIAISLSYIVNAPKEWELHGWGYYLGLAMRYYLLCLFLRTIFYVGFSFAELLQRSKVQTATEYPLVTIIIPCYNEGVVIATAIESTAAVIYPNLEILVVDDGSTDDTFFQAVTEAKKHPHIRVISKPNGGKSDALNWGIQEAIGEFVVCMDADSKLGKDVLLQGMPYFEGNPELAAVAGNVVVGNYRNNLLTKFQKLEYVIGLNFYKTAQSYLGVVNIVPGPIGIFRKNVIDKLGGYQTDTFAEDCDLTVRILMAGYSIKYNPKMRALTEAPEDIWSLFTQRYRWSRGTMQAILKNAHWFFEKKAGMRRRFLLVTMLLESLFVPMCNYLFSMGALGYALMFTNSSQAVFGPYFVGLVILDMILALYSLHSERGILELSLLTILNRLSYGLALEVLRFFALIDELLGVPMKWGVLKRKGL